MSSTWMKSAGRKRGVTPCDDVNTWQQAHSALCQVPCAMGSPHVTQKHISGMVSVSLAPSLQHHSSSPVASAYSVSPLVSRTRQERKILRPSCRSMQLSATTTAPTGMGLRDKEGTNVWGWEQR